MTLRRAESEAQTIDAPAAPVKTDDVYRVGWEPSAEQFDAYRAREVALCVIAIRRIQDLRPDHTLFSHGTWVAAQAITRSTALLLKEKSPQAA